MITQIRKADYADKTSVKDQLTKQVIGCSFKVHRELGPGFPEKVYAEALAKSLRRSGVFVESEQGFNVSFEGEIIGGFRVDLVVGHRVIVEVKAVTGFMPQVFAAQVLAYLKAARLPVGLLVNFGNTSCQVKRVVNSSAKSAVKLGLSKEQSA